MKSIYLIVGPSGSGKTTLAQKLELDYGLKSVQSYTTRPPRYPNEEGHIFVSDEEFDSLGEMIAYTEYNGYRYGVTTDLIEENDIYVIDPYGVEYMLDHYKGDKRIVIFVLECDEETRMERMLGRGDTKEQAKQRIELDKEKFRYSERILKKAFVVPVDNMTIDAVTQLVAMAIGYYEKGVTNCQTGFKAV